MSDEGVKILSGICLIAFCILALFGLAKCHRQELINDGFEIIEEHYSYYLVQKDGHQYIATEEYYGMSWNFEHYPSCPCMKNNK